ncbi:MAG: response regulator [Deltaproteobacteria bacterium]|nr:response regulator [Deltaproteobacteria bacterium]
MQNHARKAPKPSTKLIDMPESHPQKKPLILIIDDDPVVRLLVKGCLEKADFQVKETTDGHEALDLLQNCRPDLILLDLCMPGIGGFETCQKIRLQPELKEVPILIITGMNDSDSIHRAFDAGASDFITKPINFLLLLPRVQNLLRYTNTMKDLRASEERLRQVLQNMPVMLKARNEDGNFIIWNRECENVTGFKAEEILENPQAIELLYPDIATRKEMLDQWEGCKEFYNRQTELMAKDGKIKTASWSNISQKFPVPGWASWSVGIDVSLQKKAERNLLESKEKYQKLSHEFSTLLDGIPDVLLLLSSNFDIVWANKGAINHLAKGSPHVAGKKCHDLWYQCPRPCVDCPVAKCFISGETETQRRESPDGRHWGLKVFPLKDRNGHVGQTILLASDVTESVRLKEEALRASHLASIGEMAAGVAHEINNPNGLFLLNLPLLAEIYADSAPILEAHARENEDFKLANLGFQRVQDIIPRILKDMQNGANHIKHIVEDLRNFSPKRESNLDELINLNEAVNASIRLMKNPIKNATDHLIVELGENLPRIRGCFQRIEQIIINLVQNACQALNGRDKKITLSTFTSPDGRKVALVVRDEGNGIPADLLSHITDPFFTTRRNDGGTGLGLSISARIIEEHNGKLSINSKPGLGSTFTVEFPTYLEG